MSPFCFRHFQESSKFYDATWHHWTTLVYVYFAMVYVIHGMHILHVLNKMVIFPSLLFHKRRCCLSYPFQYPFYFSQETIERVINRYMSGINPYLLVEDCKTGNYWIYFNETQQMPLRFSIFLGLPDVFIYNIWSRSIPYIFHRDKNRSITLYVFDWCSDSVDSKNFSKEKSIKHQGARLITDIS